MQWLFLLLLFFTNFSIASELGFQNKPFLFVKEGNIYYTKNSGRTIQITHSKKDSSPIFSINQEKIAFVRTGNEIVPATCDADTRYGNQVWIYDFSTKKERLLVANNFKCDEPKKKIIDPTDLCFSPANKSLYFITSAWTTSGALHKVDINNAHQHYIAPANEFEIVSKGENKGDLIVYQHRYFVGGGSYDWYWLLNSEGKEEGAIGPEITKDQRDFIESNA